MAAVEAHRQRTQAIWGLVAVVVVVRERADVAKVNRFHRRTAPLLRPLTAYLAAMVRAVTLELAVLALLITLQLAAMVVLAALGVRLVLLVTRLLLSHLTAWVVRLAQLVRL